MTLTRPLARPFAFVPAGLALALALAGCGGSDPAAPPAATRQASLVTVSTMSVGDPLCVHGGSRVDSWVDANFAAVLPSSDGRTTSVACNGAPGDAGFSGPAGLVSLASEPAGDRCSAGGVRISVGVDTDRSGALDPDEVSDVAVSCHGVAGTAGAAGPAGAAGVAGAPGPGSLTALTAEPAGLLCPAGGTRITAGLDANANGILEAGEVAYTGYACNGVAGATGATGATGAAGADGLTSLTRIDAEPAGTNCPAGGSRLTSGLDADRNGLLGPTEVSATTYSCNGTNGAAGAAGADGASSLVAVVAEPAGVNCAAGGTRLQAGLDTDRDGVLDPSEVSSTSYTCNGLNGATGPVGPAGPAGPQGPAGSQGPAGPQGPAGAGLIVQVVADPTPVNAVANTSYLFNHAATSTVLLPASASLGDEFTFTGYGAGDFVLTPPAAGRIITQPMGTAVSYPNWLARPGTAGTAWSALAQSADGSRAVAVDFSGGPRLSTDFGMTWASSPLPGVQARAVAASSDGLSVIVAGAGAAGRIHRSTNGGAAWSLLAASPTLDYVALGSAANGQTLLAAGVNATLRVSTNAGASWTARDAARNWRAVAVSADGTRMAAAVFGGRIYVSTNSGASWTARAGTLNWNGVAMSADGLRLAATVAGGQLWTSVDGGTTWFARDVARNYVDRTVRMSADGSVIMAAVANDGIYRSTDGGASFARANASAVPWSALSMSADGRYAVAARGDAGGILSAYRLGAPATQTGADLGYLRGPQYGSVSLRYVDTGTYLVTGHEGQFIGN